MGALLVEPNELERLWAEHLEGEFGTKELRAFYCDVFVVSWPDDLQMQG
jgi:hypothetical protein